MIRELTRFLGDVICVVDGLDGFAGGLVFRSTCDDHSFDDIGLKLLSGFRHQFYFEFYFGNSAFVIRMIEDLIVLICEVDRNIV